MSYYTEKAESDLHRGLVTDLLGWLKNSKGYRITAADLSGYSEPGVVENKSKVGDGDDKQPDIDAFDDTERVYVRGEAKTGNGDLTSEHSKTQFLLFSDRFNRENNKESLLYVIVPASKMNELKAVLSELGLADKDNVIPVKSGKYQ